MHEFQRYTYSTTFSKHTRLDDILGDLVWWLQVRRSFGRKLSPTQLKNVCALAGWLRYWTISLKFFLQFTEHLRKPLHCPHPIGVPRDCRSGIQAYSSNCSHTVDICNKTAKWTDQSFCWQETWRGKSVFSCNGRIGKFNSKKLNGMLSLAVLFFSPFLFCFFD